MSRIKSWFKRTPLYPVLRAMRDVFRTRSPHDRIEARDARATRRILRTLLRPDDNCIDVGAHAEDVLAECLRLAPRGTHAAVEPIPYLAAALRARFPGVEVHHAAATDTNGPLEFTVVISAPAFSGIRRRPDLAPDLPTETVRVLGMRLDDLIPPDRPIRLLKIDVEGAELGVLRGAARLLARWRPWVLFEHGSAAAVYGTTTADVFAELSRHGLSIWTLPGWIAGDPPLTCEGLIAAVASGDYWNFLAGVATGPLPTDATLPAERPE